MESELTVKDPRLNPFDKKVSTGRNLLHRYKISVEQYNDMLQAQQGVCAICEEECLTKRRLAVDHNHETGKVRGLLCSRCNQAIGSLRTKDNLYNAIKYLEKNDG